MLTQVKLLSRATEMSMLAPAAARTHSPKFEIHCTAEGLTAASTFNF